MYISEMRLVNIQIIYDFRLKTENSVSKLFGRDRKIITYVRGFETKLDRYTAIGKKCSILLKKNRVWYCIRENTAFYSLTSTDNQSMICTFVFHLLML